VAAIEQTLKSTDSVFSKKILTRSSGLHVKSHKSVYFLTWSW